MEMNFLLTLQNLHHPIADFFFSHITLLANGGIFWILICILFLCSKKYRTNGIYFLLSLLLCFIIGNLFLKNIIARPRPCWINPQIPLLIPNPSDFSFPSGHSLHSFAGAVSIWYANRKWGIFAFILAGIIAFSRLYLFVHYPSDVVAGIVLGIIVTVFVHKAGAVLQKKRAAKEGDYHANV